jgi:hypothetical protein
MAIFLWCGPQHQSYQLFLWLFHLVLSLKVTKHSYGYSCGVVLSLKVTSYSYGYIPMAIWAGLQPQNYQLFLWLFLWGDFGAALAPFSPQGGEP